MLKPLFTVLVCISVFSMPTNAVIEVHTFEKTELEQRFKNLIAELRCLVCQNQNIADSDADLAKDLRRKTAELLKAGYSDQQILDYMSERYGEFILYRPPFSVYTAILWLAPLALAVTIIVVAVQYSRRPQNADSKLILSDYERNKIDNLLAQNSDNSNPHVSRHVDESSDDHQHSKQSNDDGESK